MISKSPELEGGATFANAIMFGNVHQLKKYLAIVQNMFQKESVRGGFIKKLFWKYAANTHAEVWFQ